MAANRSWMHLRKAGLKLGTGQRADLLPALDDSALCRRINLGPEVVAPP